MQKCVLASFIIKEGFYIANAPGVFPEAFLEVPSRIELLYLVLQTNA